MPNTHGVVGRPRYPLLLGQRTYAIVCYSRRLHSQLDIAAHLRVAYPRVRRFLIESGLYEPREHGSAAHTSAVTQAVQMYKDGDPVAQILETTGLVTSELYRGLRINKIPLRTHIYKGGNNARKRGPDLYSGATDGAALGSAPEPASAGEPAPAQS